MSTKITKYASIICEGCGAVHGKPDQYEGSADARRGALAAGWTLVPKKLADGRSARVTLTDKALVNITRSAHDVCPECVGSFDAGSYVHGGSYRSGGKAWFTERIERLEAENARLRSGGSP